MADPIFFERRNPVARELAPARLRSSRSSANTACLNKRDSWFWGCSAAQREQAPSPQRQRSGPMARALEPASFASNSAARTGRRFVLCLPLETPLMPVRHWQAVLLTLVVLCGLGGCSGNYKYNDNTYRPLGDPQAVNRGK